MHAFGFPTCLWRRPILYTLKKKALPAYLYLRRREERKAYPNKSKTENTCHFPYTHTWISFGGGLWIGFKTVFGFWTVGWILDLVQFLDLVERMDGRAIGKI